MMQTSETFDNIVRHILVVQLIISAVCAVGSLAGCSRSYVGELEKGGCMPNRTIEQVQQEHTDEWMAIPGIEGIGIGLFEDKPCIKIFSSVAPEQLRNKIPSIVEGYAVIIEDTGAFHSLDRQ